MANDTFHTICSTIEADLDRLEADMAEAGRNEVAKLRKGMRPLGALLEAMERVVRVCQGELSDEYDIRDAACKVLVPAFEAFVKGESR